MSVDLTAGLGAEREFVFGSQPEDPLMRESVNAWIWDGGDEIGMPRVGVEAVADQWDTHEIQVNITTGSGRNLNLFGSGEIHDPLGADGRPRILGAGPLAFELVEPFRHWRMRLDGPAVEGTVDDQIAGIRSGKEPSVPVEVEIEMTSVAPPWENGALLPEAKRVLEEQDGVRSWGGRASSSCRERRAGFA